MALNFGSYLISPTEKRNNINNQSNKTITPNTSQQIITYDSGYVGLNQVTVNAIPSSYIIPSGTLTVSAPGTVNAKSYASVSIPGMANPTWTSAILTSSTGKINYSFHITSGFKSTSQVYTSSITLPSITGTTITPSETSQIAINSYQWTKGSVIVNAIPNSVAVYKKIVERTITIPELNSFLSSQSSIPSYAFMLTSTLNGSTGGTLNFYALTSIPTYAFSSCSYLTSISGENITSIGSQAFYNCSRIESVFFPNLEYIGNQAFYCCNSITEINFSKLSIISGSPFSRMNNLLTVSLPLLSILRGYDFYKCPYLTNVSLPEVTLLSGYSHFGYCSSLSYLYLPKLSLISGAYGQFIRCYQLSWVSFPLLEKISVASSIFSSCSKLMSVYFMSTSVITLTNTYQSNIFIGTPIVNSTLTGSFGSIYVPSTLVNDYKTHSIWSWFSDRFVGV